MADTSMRRDRLPDCAAPALLGATRGLQIGDRYLAAWCLDLLAVAVAAAGDQRRAAAILAAVDAAWHAMHIEPDPDEHRRDRCSRAEGRIPHACGRRRYRNSSPSNVPDARHLSM
jgi:hypothetical protein